MAIEILQITTSSTPALAAILAPNSQVIMSVPSASTTVFTGLSNTVNATSGYAVNPGVPHTFSIPPSSQSGSLWAFSTAASVLSLLVVTTT